LRPWLYNSERDPSSRFYVRTPSHSARRVKLSNKQLDKLLTDEKSDKGRLSQDETECSSSERLILPSIREEPKERRSPWFTFKDISKKPKVEEESKDSPMEFDLLRNPNWRRLRTNCKEARVMSEHSRTQSELSQCSDRADRTVHRMEHEVEACREIQDQFF